MQKLHLVGFTTDLDGLIFSARKGSKAGGYVVPLDKELLATITEAERLRDGDKGDEEGARHRGRPDSRLTPREIQAHLRTGRSIPEVAAEAGVDLEWVERFAVPVVAEQAQMVERARAMTYSKARLGQSTQPLGTSVRWNLADKGVAIGEDAFELGWSAFQLQDEVWMIRFRYTSRARLQVAEWELDLDANQLLSRNRLASELGYVEKGRRPPALPAPPPRPAAAPPMRVVEEVEPEPEPEERPAPVRRRRPATSRRTRRSASRKRATPKKASTKKATKQKVAKKKVAKKKVARKTARRPTARRSTAKQSSGRRSSTAKRPAAKKTTARKSTTTRRATAAKTRRPARATASKAATEKRTVTRTPTPARSRTAKAVAEPAPARLAATKAAAQRRQAPAARRPAPERERRPTRPTPEPEPEPEFELELELEATPAPKARPARASRPRIAAAPAREAAASKRSGHGAARRTQTGRPIRQRSAPARAEGQVRKTAGEDEADSPTLTGPLARSLLARRLMARKSAEGDGGQESQRPLRVR